MEKRTNWFPSNLEQLLTGKESPQDEKETLLLKTYKSAMSGELLIMFLTSLGGKLDVLNVDEINAILIGYAIGQNDMIKLEEKLLATYSKNTNGLN